MKCIKKFKPEKESLSHDTDTFAGAFLEFSYNQLYLLFHI